MEPNSKGADGRGQNIWFFGHFGSSNFGNESTLQAALYHLRRLLPNAEVGCICTRPEVTAATHNIEAIPISGTVIKPWNLHNPLARLLRKVFIGIPSELYLWLDAFRTLRGTDMLIIPGTGLLTDAYGLRAWGPYNLFKWTLMAKLGRCKVVFASVGAGPINSVLGRYFVKTALSLANFRSYRDLTSLQCAKNIGVRANDDRIYPDLVFSLPDLMIPAYRENGKRRPTVGLGLMEFAGKYSIELSSGANTRPYLEKLVVFVKWLLTHQYDIRLLIGDSGDRDVTKEFRCLLKARLGAYDEERIIDQPVSSVKEFLSQLAATDMVVATRFHNVLMAMLLNKPVIAISFHHKCASLMEDMGLSKYCLDINRLSAEGLIELFSELVKNAEKLRPLIRLKREDFRKALDEQYNLIFNGM